MIANLIVPENYIHGKLDCPSATHKYNNGTYRTSKFILMGLATIGIIICAVVVANSENPKIQTIFATIIGGLSNIIVWLLTTFVTDKMSRERDEIDRLIDVVDQHIYELHRDIVFEDRKAYVRQIAPKNLLEGRIMWFQQNCLFLADDNDIDSSKLRLSWDGKDYTLREVVELAQKMFESQFDGLTDLHGQMVEWNVYYLDQQLRYLRRKLMTCKSKISMKNPSSQ